MVVINNIYAIIKDKGLKQSAVATKAGYSINAFNSMLRGRKQILAEDIVRIAKALDVTPNDLYGYTERA